MNARRIRNPAVAYCVFAIAALASATVPLLSRAPRAMTAADASFPGWPTHFEGRPLTTLPLSERESAFSKDFPGHIGRFSDGRREIIVRYMSAPTRRLHPAADCLKAVGYSIAPSAVRRDASGAPMSCLKASRNGQSLHVCELIRGAHDESWPDVSAWYWNALIGGAQGPWWSFVVAQPE